MTDLLLASVYRPNEKINGYQQVFLQEQWWRTHLGISADENPLLYDDTTDPDGIGGSSDKASLATFDGIQFLTGNLGGTSERTITIEGNKPLFFPILNIFGPTPIDTATLIERPFDDAYNAEKAFWDLVFFQGNLTELRASIDGVEILQIFDGSTGNALDNYYLESILPYDVNVPNNNIYGVDSGIYGGFISSGVYLGVDNLSPEEHIIQFYADAFDGGFILEVTYNISYDLNEIEGTPDADNPLEGTEEWDEILGLNGEDYIVGYEGNDYVNGGNQSDILIGVNPHAPRPGEGEIDILDGGTDGALDTYVLGDFRRSYYLGEGARDYAIVRNFDDGDTIQLKGSAQRYELDSTMTLGGVEGTAIIHRGNEELIGFVEERTDLNLASSNFTFV